MNYGFILDNRKCIGCHACTVACKSEHDVPIGVNRTWVKYIERGIFPESRRYFTVMRCNHCENPPCVEICPVGAMFQREDGIVDFNKERCIGCKSCTQACPYESIYMDPDTNTAAKCNYCAHRIDQGLNPACVNICPEQAIIAGDMDNPESSIAKMMGRHQISARKVEKGTTPKVYYINGEGSALHPMAAPPQKIYQQTAQAAGVGHYAKYTEARIAANDTQHFAASGASVAPYHKENPEKYGATIADAGGQKPGLMKGLFTRRSHDAPQKGIMWRWEVPAYLWAKAISAGLFLVTALIGLTGMGSFDPSAEMGYMVLSLLFLGLTTAALVKDLDKPARFIYVMLRPQFNSWLTRGGYLLATFGFALVFWMGARYFGISSIEPFAIGLGVISGFLLAIYTAFLLAQAKGRDFWQSPLMPLHMLVHSLIAGAAFISMTAGYFKLDQELVSLVNNGLITGLVSNLLIIAMELLTAHPTTDSKLAVNLIVKGKLSTQFYAGALVAGHLIPLGMLIMGGGMGAAAGLLVLIGMYITESIWIKAPQMIPNS